MSGDEEAEWVTVDIEHQTQQQRRQKSGSHPPHTTREGDDDVPYHPCNSSPDEIMMLKRCSPHYDAAIEHEDTIDMARKKMALYHHGSPVAALGSLGVGISESPMMNDKIAHRLDEFTALGARNQSLPPLEQLFDVEPMPPAPGLSGSSSMTSSLMDDVHEFLLNADDDDHHHYDQALMQQQQHQQYDESSHGFGACGECENSNYMMRETESSQKFAAAFASVTRHVTKPVSGDKQRFATIISLQLVHKDVASRGTFADLLDDTAKQPSRVYNRFSIIGPLDRATEQEMREELLASSSSLNPTSACTRTTTETYVVQDCDGSVIDFDSLDEQSKSDFMWNWTYGDNDDDDDTGNVVARGVDDTSDGQTESTRSNRIKKKTMYVIGRRDGILCHFSTKFLREKLVPSLVATHLVTMLLGVVIGRRMFRMQQAIAAAN